jgi:hypothetical protein
MGLMAYPKRKGFLYSHTSFTLLQGAEKLEGVQSFKFTPKVDGRELVYANSSISVGRVRGKLSIEVEAKFLQQSWGDWVAGHPAWMFELFNWTALWEEGPDSLGFAISDCTFENTEIGSDDGANTVTMKGMAANLEIEGVSIADVDALGVALGVDFSVAGALGF